MFRGFLRKLWPLRASQPKIPPGKMGSLHKTQRKLKEEIAALMVQRQEYVARLHGIEKQGLANAAVQKSARQCLPIDDAAPI